MAKLKNMPKDFLWEEENAVEIKAGTLSLENEPRADCLSAKLKGVDNEDCFAYRLEKIYEPTDHAIKYVQGRFADMDYEKLLNNTKKQADSLELNAFGGGKEKEAIQALMVNYRQAKNDPLPENFNPNRTPLELYKDYIHLLALQARECPPQYKFMNIKLTPHNIQWGKVDHFVDKISFK